MDGSKSDLILGAIVGLLLGLGWCYYKQLKAAYDNRGIIGATSDLVTASQNFAAQLGAKL